MPTKLRSRRAAVLLLSVVAIVLSCGGVAPAFAAESEMQFRVNPGAWSQTDPSGAFFSVSAGPGATVAQALELHNDSDRPLTLQVQAVDAATAVYGGASYGTAESETSGAGAWIALDAGQVLLAPGESRVLPFRISLPDAARTGVHLAGLSVGLWEDSENAPDAVAGRAGASVDVRTRRVVAVQVNVPGPSDAELLITSVRPIARPDGLYLAIGIANTGHGLTKAKGTVVLPSGDFSREFPIGTFVPGTTITYPVKWSTAAEKGVHDAVVNIEYGSKSARWTGTFRVGEEVQREQRDRQVAQAEFPGAVDSRSLPLGVAAAVSGAALLTGVVLARRRHDRSDRQFTNEGRT